MIFEHQLLHQHSRSEAKERCVNGACSETICSKNKMLYFPEDFRKTQILQAHALWWGTEWKSTFQRVCCDISFLAWSYIIQYLAVFGLPVVNSHITSHLFSRGFPFQFNANTLKAQVPPHCSRQSGWLRLAADLPPSCSCYESVNVSRIMCAHLFAGQTSPVVPSIGTTYGNVTEWSACLC